MWNKKKVATTKEISCKANSIGLDKQKNLRKIVNIFLSIFVAYVLGSHMKRLNETEFFWVSTTYVLVEK